VSLRYEQKNIETVFLTLLNKSVIGMGRSNLKLSTPFHFFNFHAKIKESHQGEMNDQEKFIFDLANDLESILDDIQYDFGYDNVAAEKLQDLIEKVKEYQENL